MVRSTRKIGRKGKVQEMEDEAKEKEEKKYARKIEKNDYEENR